MAKAKNAAEVLRQSAIELSGRDSDYDPLLDMIGDRRFVLLGEASHGTDDFYRERAAITRRLIEEKGFAGVVAEADWPDAYRVNCYVKGEGDTTTADEALRGFIRFPTWMWRNHVVAEFSDWLRDCNDNLPRAERAGFYGMDLYSLFTSMRAVIDYLDDVDPDAAALARRRYSCFDHFGEDSQAYGYTAAYGAGESCEKHVVEQLTELCRSLGEYVQRNGAVAEDAAFYAEQNALLVKDAEEYYRSMFRGRGSSWNLRDRHMVRSLDALADHLTRQRGEPAKLVVWAHNSHLGDARATEMGARGELNVGQLVRERWPEESFLVGFSTYTGWVTAADDWDAPTQRKRVRPGLAGSYEDVFHETGLSRFLVDPRADDLVEQALFTPRLQRAIGVIYRPQTERMSHYFTARVTAQFDAVLHFDETTALEPLDVTERWHRGEEAPETYPYAV